MQKLNHDALLNSLGVSPNNMTIQEKRRVTELFSQSASMLVSIVKGECTTNAKDSLSQKVNIEAKIFDELIDKIKLDISLQPTKLKPINIINNDKNESVTEKSNSSNKIKTKKDLETLQLLIKDCFVKVKN